MNALRTALIASHRQRDFLDAQEALSALKADKDWVRRYCTGDAVAVNEQGYWLHVAEHGYGAPYLCPMPTPKTAMQMRRDAELMYDGPIPADVLAAIHEQEKREFVPVTERKRLDFDPATRGSVWPKEPTLAELNARLVRSMERQKPKGCVE